MVLLFISRVQRARETNNNALEHVLSLPRGGMLVGVGVEAEQQRVVGEMRRFGVVHRSGHGDGGQAIGVAVERGQ